MRTRIITAYQETPEKLREVFGDLKIYAAVLV
jgi:hypothetical protein